MFNGMSQSQTTGRFVTLSDILVTKGRCQLHIAIQAVISTSGRANDQVPPVSDVGKAPAQIADVARDTRLHRNTITLLYYETATRVDIESIQQLCNLFNCNVGDLVEHVSDSAAKKAGAR